WVGRAREYDRRPPAERRRPGRGVRDHRAQVVLLGADVRCVPRAGADGQRALVLPAAALDAGRRAQRVPSPAAQGQARQPLKRVGLAVSKYWVCKSAPWHIGEALECLGGNGYVELSGMPRLYREAPLNSIWEGSGNVNCLDVLRGMVRSPESVEAFFAEVASP